MDEKFGDTSLVFNLMSATLAFLAWGGWAFYVNEHTVPSTGLVAGLTQGLYSFLMTLITVRVVGYVFKRTSTEGLRLFVPAMLTVGATTAALVLAHSFAQTPNIFFTIMPAVFVAFAFCVFTTHRLRISNQLISESD